MYSVMTQHTEDECYAAGRNEQRAWANMMAMAMQPMTPAYNNGMWLCTHN